METAAQASPARPMMARPCQSWAGPAVLRYQSAAEDWGWCLKTISANNAAGLIDRTEVKQPTRYCSGGQSPEPLRTGSLRKPSLPALEAHKHAPDLGACPPVVGAAFCPRLGELRRAVKTLDPQLGKLNLTLILLKLTHMCVGVIHRRGSGQRSQNS